MPAYNPSLYPSHPIQIPEELPKILKNYTKAAIRTQPTDLLLWSAYYFRCLSNGEIPPVKERLEYPLPETWYGLTPGLIRVLNKQLGSTKNKTHVQTLRKKWRGLSLDLDHLDKVLNEGGFKGQSEIEWRRFLALICIGVAHNKDVDQAMKIVSEAFADQSRGEGCSLAAEEFIDMFKYVASVKGLTDSKTKDIIDYLESAGEKQDGILSYENFKTDLCPPIH